MLPIYIYKKRTWEDPYYFNKESPSKDNNNDKKIEDNKVNKENKGNIPKNKPYIIWFSNKIVQTSLVQEEKEYN